MADSVQAALDGLPDGALLAGHRGVVVAVNAAACRLLETEVSPGDRLAEAVRLQDLEGNSWFGCTQPYDGFPLRTELVETSWWTVSGREVLVTARLGRVAPGGPVDHVALSLRGARARERAERSRSELVTTVAHELRSPLTGVKGFTATLIDKWARLTDSQKLLMLNTVDADADRLTRLITELLDVARIDSGRLSVRTEPLEIGSAVRSLLASLRPPTGRRLDVRIQADPIVWVDRDRLAQILSNLVENAYAHGAGTVTVTLLDRRGGGAELIVDDEGDGIADSIRARVFTKFWHHGRAGGTGLGLFIVAGLVGAHDGEVRVESSPAGGARFRVILPAGAPAILD